MPLAVVVVGGVDGFVLFLHDGFFVAGGENVADKQSKNKAGSETSDGIENDKGDDVEEISIVHNLLFPEMAKA